MDQGGMTRQIASAQKSEPHKLGDTCNLKPGT
jgi:hypothetical protein